ncbi:AAEL014767-PA [Aedes aegypti]|uniref:AAEL014767-PA n=2 Tax=Aedes aegypti TaxID=7159 RepID=Q16FG1_AEDAE|nr:AAEL014767-PA [Aedes aegypti]
MTSVTVLAAILLGPLLWCNGYAITIASDKKVSASEKERKTESLTFSANGEDQLIFSDTTFQVRNDGSRGVPGPIRRSTEDQFYTVKATIQIQESDGSAITPPTFPITTKRPKKKKGKIYNQHGIDIRKQDGFNYQQPQDYDNYLQNGQHQANYQIPPTPQSIPDSSYYQNPGPSSPGTPYPPFDPSNFYIQNYLANYPYPQQPAPIQQPYADASASYPQQPNVPTNLINGGQSDSPISPQSIFGFLQSIFNFAPGTFGNYPPTQTQSPSSHVSDLTGGAHVQHSPAASGGSASPIMAVSSQLRKALDNIAGNDELQCVPKLICMMSRRSSGQGFSTYVNRGLLST